MHNASSTDYTLKIMTVVALVMTPVVLLYQGWTYWVFRKRITVDMLPPERRTRRGRRGVVKPFDSRLAKYTRALRPFLAARTFLRVDRHGRAAGAGVPAR